MKLTPRGWKRSWTRSKKERLKWTDALHEFYDKFEGDLDKFKVLQKDIKEKEIPTEEVCLKCNTPGMVQKWGRFGKYLKCLSCDATRDAEPPAGSMERIRLKRRRPRRDETRSV